MLVALKKEFEHKWLGYPLFLMPVTPPIVLLMKFSALNSIEDLQIFDLEYVEESFAWCALVVSIPLWFGLYLYLDTVVPNEYGVNKGPCFCLAACRRSEAIKFEGTTDEEIPQNDPIRLEKLTRKFGNFTAVNELSLTIKKNEIFSLLGHNGAGKTTAIYMITGVLKPTSGDATIYGSRISDQIERVQSNLGLCHQFDVLDDQLTVREHLELVCGIKCMPYEQVEKAINECLE